jgi:hypothetical protein
MNDTTNHGSQPGKKKNEKGRRGKRWTKEPA